ncbi:MAG: hypothetical protein RIQ94_3185, partial [Pseudomonadota bacterium]
MLSLFERMMEILMLNNLKMLCGVKIINRRVHSLIAFGVGLYCLILSLTPAHAETYTVGIVPQQSAVIMAR